MRRHLALLLPLLLLGVACGDDDGGEAADETSTTVAGEPSTTSSGTAEDGGSEEPAATPPSTVATDAPAGEGDGGAEDEGLGDALLVADLSPEAAVPGPGSTGSSGRFEAELVDGVLCVDMVVRDLGDVVVGAHVHDGAAGTAGPVVVDLGEPTSMVPSEAVWTDACTEVPDDVIERLAAAPDAHHVDVHSPSFPDGAVRGQLAVASVFDRTLG